MDMKALLIYPKFPDTFWSFTYALGFIGKKAAFPPLGLLTVFRHGIYGKITI